MRRVPSFRILECTRAQSSDVARPNLKTVIGASLSGFKSLPLRFMLSPDQLEGLAAQPAEPSYTIDRFLHSVGLGFPRCPALINRAIEAAKARDWSLSADLFGRLCARHPDMADYWFRLAAVRNAAGQPVLARKAAERSIALDPRSAQVRVILGHALLLTGDYQGARAAFDGAIAVEPDNVEAQAERLVLVARENPVQSLSASDQLESIDPTDSIHQLRIAAIANGTGLMDAALAIYERTRDIQTGEGSWEDATQTAVQIWAIQSAKLDRAAQLKAGEQMVDFARKRGPGEHPTSLRKILLMHGLTLSVSDPASALAVFDEANRLEPKDERDRLDELARRLVALDNLGSIEEERRIANDMIETGRRIGDKEFELQGMRHLAYCHLSDGNNVEAMRRMDEVLGMYGVGGIPQEAASLIAAGYVAWMAGSPDKAKEHVAAALVHPDSTGIVASAVATEADLILGSIALDRGDLEEADTRLARAVNTARKSYPAELGMRFAELARLRVVQIRLSEARELIDEARKAARRPEAIKLVDRAESALEAAEHGPNPDH